MIPWHTINGLDLLWIACAACFWFLWREELRMRKVIRDELANERAKVDVLVSCIRIGGGGLTAIRRMLVKTESSNDKLDSLVERIKRGVV